MPKKPFSVMRIPGVARCLPLLLSCAVLVLAGCWLWQWNRDCQYVDSARTGDVRSVQRYLRDGVPVDVQSIGGMTALRWACYNGHEDVVRVLLAHGANPTAGLWNARQRHRLRIIALLQQAGAKG